MLNSYHVRPDRSRRGWRVELEGAWGYESRRSEREARNLARLLARANRPSMVVVHGVAGDVRAKLRYIESAARAEMGGRWRPA